MPISLVRRVAAQFVTSSQTVLGIGASSFRAAINRAIRMLRRVLVVAPVRWLPLLVLVSCCEPARSWDLTTSALRVARPASAAGGRGATSEALCRLQEVALQVGAGPAASPARRSSPPAWTRRRARNIRVCGKDAGFSQSRRAEASLPARLEFCFRLLPVPAFRALADRLHRHT